MEQAVEVMAQSIMEPRKDGKASPLVGAVLVRDGGVIESAYRGELREGDHAEFTLLERKNRASKLDGAILFATLEPCAPGSRKHPKLGCAERIVNARIKEVWVGIEDPDPTVDRKGIRYLQEHGVKVTMFDRDLQEKIKDANKDFILQALERKDAAEKMESYDNTLSALELKVPNVNLSDFSDLALDRYRQFTVASGDQASESFQRRLTQQGLLEFDGEQLVPTGFGMLLFGKSPRSVMPQAGLLGTIHYPNGSEEVMDFDGPMVLIPEQVEKWLSDKLPNLIDRSEAQRKQTIKKFLELIREGVTNALVHRNYEIVGAKCQLSVSPDYVTIMSPGQPVSPVTFEQLRRFEAPMLSRNPQLHFVFAKMELAEERGLGLKSMRAGASEIGLPLPVYGWNDPYLELKVFRTSDGAVKSLPPATQAKLSEDEKSSWIFISGKQSLTSPELMKQMGFDERKAQRILKTFKTLELLRPVGKGPATRYEVV